MAGWFQRSGGGARQPVEREPLINALALDLDDAVHENGRSSAAAKRSAAFGPPVPINYEVRACDKACPLKRPVVQLDRKTPFREVDAMQRYLFVAHATGPLTTHGEKSRRKTGTPQHVKNQCFAHPCC